MLVLGATAPICKVFVPLFDWFIARSYEQGFVYWSIYEICNERENYFIVKKRLFYIFGEKPLRHLTLYFYSFLFQIPFESDMSP